MSPANWLVGQKVVGAEVPAEEGQVVVAAFQVGGEVLGRPGAAGRGAVGADEGGVGVSRFVQPCREGRLDLGGGRLHEVVAGDEGRLGVDDGGSAEIVGDGAQDVGRGLYQASDGRGWEGHGVALDGQDVRGPILVVAQVVGRLQGRVGRRRGRQRGLVIRLGGDAGLVGIAEERYDVVVTDDHHVLKVGGRDPVAVDDVLDGLGFEVLGEGTLRILSRLVGQVVDLLALTHVDQSSVGGRSQLHQRRVQGRCAAVARPDGWHGLGVVDDDGLVGRAARGRDGAVGAEVAQLDGIAAGIDT
jgi:hypothetical protein